MIAPVRNAINFPTLAEVNEILSEVDQSVQELATLGLNESGLEKSVIVRSRIVELRKRTRVQEVPPGLIKPIEQCEFAFQSVLRTRKNNIVSDRFEILMANGSYESILRLMVDHSDWVDDHLDKAIEVIKMLGKLELQKACRRSWDDPLLPPKSIGYLIATLFYNNFNLEEMSRDFTFKAQRQVIQANSLLVLTNFGTVFDVGSREVNLDNPRIKLDCNPDSLKAILEYLCTKDEKVLLPLFEENFITANKYGINCVVRSLRNQYESFKKSMNPADWQKRMESWQDHPVIATLSGSTPSSSVDLYEYRLEHEERMASALNMMEEFAKRVERQGTSRDDSYLSLELLREASELLLRTAVSGQIQEEDQLYKRYLDVLHKIHSFLQTIGTAENEENLITNPKFFLFHEDELHQTLLDHAKTLDAISVSCISACNLFKSTLPQDLLEHRTWHGESVKVALRMVGTIGKTNAQESVVNFIGRAIRQSSGFSLGQKYHVLLRHSSGAALPTGKVGSVITASYWDPFHYDIRHFRIHAIFENSRWTYVDEAGQRQPNSSPWDLFAEMCGPRSHIVWIPRPQGQTEVRNTYINI